VTKNLTNICLRQINMPKALFRPEPIK